MDSSSDQADPAHTSSTIKSQVPSARLPPRPCLAKERDGAIASRRQSPSGTKGFAKKGKYGPHVFDHLHQPRPGTRKIDKEQIPTIGAVEMRDRCIKSLRSLGDAWGHVHNGVQGRSTTLNELRDGFRDLKKDVEEVEKLLKSTK